MDIACPACGRSIRVPDSAVTEPDRKARCLGCKASVRVADARRLETGKAPTVPPVPQTPRTDSSGAGLSATVDGRPSQRVTTLPGLTRPPAPNARPSRSVPSLDGSLSGRLDGMAPRTTGRLAVGGPAWMTCSTHLEVKSDQVCEGCGKGWCRDCASMLQSVALCPDCKHPCVSASSRRKSDTKERDRSRSLFEELPTILGYPVSDMVSFVILSVIVGFFDAARSFAMGPQATGFSVVLGQGLLMAYTFTAVVRVSRGDMKAAMPDVSGMEDLVDPLRLSGAAALVCMLPLIVSIFAFDLTDLPSVGSRPSVTRHRSAPKPAPEPTGSPATPSPGAAGAVHAEDGPEAALDRGLEAQAASIEELGRIAEKVQEGQTLEQAAGGLLGDAGEAAPPPVRSFPWMGVLVAIACVLWAIGYGPAAFMVAVMSRSFFSTLDPRLGLEAVRVMGRTYTHAVLICFGLSAVETLAMGLAGLIPMATLVLSGFARSYLHLALACTMGLALNKKAEDLGIA